MRASAYTYTQIHTFIHTHTHTRTHVHAYAYTRWVIRVARLFVSCGTRTTEACHTYTRINGAHEPLRHVSHIHASMGFSCSTTHWNMRHDSFVRATRLIRTCSTKVSIAKRQLSPGEAAVERTCEREALQHTATHTHTATRTHREMAHSARKCS